MINIYKFTVVCNTHTSIGTGTLSMYNFEKNKNASQFMITFKPLMVLNGRHVVFGRVIGGMNTLRLVCTHFTKYGQDN